MEEAAASLGAVRARRSSGASSSRTSCPAILSGVALAFARAVGEFGSVVIISGNLPFKTRGRVRLHLRADRERRRRRARRRSSVVLLVISFGAPARRSAALRRHRDEARPCVGYGLRGPSRSATSPSLLRRAGRARLLARRSRTGFGPAWDAVTTPDAIHAFKLTLMIARDRRAAEHRSSAIVCRARDRAAAASRGKGLLNALVDLPLALSPVVVGLALFLLYGRERLVRRGCGARRPGALRAARRWCWRRSSSRCRSSSARSCRCCARSATSRSRRPRTLGACGLADVLAHHAAGDPLGRGLRRRAHDRALARRVRRGRGRLRGVSAARPRRRRCTSRSASRAFDLVGAYASSVVLGAARRSRCLLAMTLLKPKEGIS